MLEILYKYDRLWVKYVLELGCNIDTAKDIVQEFYLKMHQIDADYTFNKDEPNFYGCYVVLRNMVFDLKRKEKNLMLVDEDNIAEEYEEEYSENDVMDKIKCVFEWLKENDADLDDKNLNYKDIKKIYFSSIFKEVFLNKKKISVFSRELNISYDSLYHTVQLIKKEITNKYETRNFT